MLGVTTNKYIYLDIDVGAGDKLVRAYCVKCKKKVTMKSPKDYKMKNGRMAKKGKCPTCGTTVFRIGG